MKAVLKALVLLPFFSKIFATSGANLASKGVEQAYYETDRDKCWEVRVPCEHSMKEWSTEECQAQVQNRYSINTFHQLGEYVYPIIDRAVAGGKAPGHVWWRFTLMPLPLELLQLAMPETVFSHGIWSPEPDGCKTAESREIIYKSWNGIVWPKTGHLAADILRHKVYKYCNMTHVSGTDNIGATNQLSLSVQHPKLISVQIVILERINVIHTRARCNDPHEQFIVKRRHLDPVMYGAITQNFKHHLEHEIQNQTEQVVLSFGKLGIRHIPKNPGSLCDQVRRFAGAHILVSVHGAHLSLANFMLPKSVLIEVLPWACHELTHFRRIVQSTGIGYAKMCGNRPISSRVKIPDFKVCSNNPHCREMVRDCFPVVVGGAGCRGCSCTGTGVADSVSMLRHFYSPNITGANL